MIFFLFYFGKKESDNCQSCLNAKIEKFRSAPKSRTLSPLQNGLEKSPISVLGLYVWVQSLNIITLHFAPKHLHSRSFLSISFEGRGEEKKKKNTKFKWNRVTNRAVKQWIRKEEFSKLILNIHHRFEPHFLLNFGAPRANPTLQKVYPLISHTWNSYFRILLASNFADTSINYFA